MFVFRDVSYCLGCHSYIDLYGPEIPQFTRGQEPRQYF